MPRISRREFLKLAAVTGINLSLGGCELLTPSRPGAERCLRAKTAPDAEFDYIVVGSGAGGGPLAANLADAGYKVLLLEAGGEHENASYSVPAFHPMATEDQDLQWNYFVKHYASEERQSKDTKLVPGKGIWYPRAGTLGGCTAHNAMITIYPHESDWDRIVKLTGDASWSPSNMRKYFQLVERCQYCSPPWDFVTRGRAWDFVTGGQHGFNGWLPTERPDLMTLWRVGKDPQLTEIVTSAARATLKDLSESLLKRLIEKVGAILLGQDINHLDSIRERPDGLYITPLATNNGRRASTRDRICEVQRRHPDRLVLETNALVKKVMLEKAYILEGVQYYRASSVEYLRGPHLYQADPKAGEAPLTPEEVSKKAMKEVILSAGAFNAPQLLMLSGVGPRNELERHGIPVLIDLPGVGKNLQDRYEVGVVYKIKENFSILQEATFAPLASDPHYREWEKGTGFLYSSNGVVIAILKRSEVARKAKEDPDLFIFGLPTVFKGYEPGYSAKGITTKDHFTWLVLKAHTRNTGGEVTLRSKDPRDMPKIDFKYFEEGNDTNKGKEDLDAMVEGVEFVREIMKPIVEAGRAEEVWPGRQGLQEWIMNEAWGHHASCSCKIGPKEDPMAVLDSNFRVRGTTNLRVVDASVFPYIPGFFIVLAIYMISEKASDEILKDAKRVSV